jgi:DNA-directed RNA polymerase specialized sigma24 family protein
MCCSSDAIFTRYHRAIYAYLLGIVGDVEQAQDLAQDTFLKAYTALARTPDPVLPV